MNCNGILGSEGIQFIVAAEILHVRGRSGEADQRSRVRTASGERTIEGSDILVATGRIPNTCGIGLDSAGVELDDRGYIRVNGRLETRHPMSGPSASAPAVRSSRMHPWTIFASFATTLLAAAATRMIGWFPIACSPTRHWRASD